MSSAVDEHTDMECPQLEQLADSDVLIKREPTDDGYHGNSLLHVINIPAPSYHGNDKKPSVTDLDNFSKNYAENQLYERSKDEGSTSAKFSVVQVKQENPPSDTSQSTVRVTVIQSDTSMPTTKRIMKLENGQGSHVVYRRIGELITAPDRDEDDRSTIAAEDEAVPQLLSLNDSTPDLEPVPANADSDEEERMEEGTDEEWSKYEDCSSLSSEDSFGSSASPRSSPIRNKHDKFSCEMCSKILSSPKGLKIHQSHCHKETDEAKNNSDESPASSPSKTYQCPDCNKYFHSPNFLLLHSLTHSQEFPFVCKQDNCDSTFKTKADLESHRKAFHDPRKKKYVCDVPGCHKVFRSSPGQKRHISTHHSQPSEFGCSVCSMKFSTLVKRQHHYATTHGQTSRCDQCSKEFTTVAMLKQHMLVHSESRPHTCPKQDCNKAFKCAGDLRRHLIGHSKLKVFHCNICQNSFKSRSDLKKHSAVHQTQKTHECPECGKFFKNSEHLRKHRVHHKDRSALTRYRCPVEGCDKAFPVPLKLHNHIARHSSERAYKCDVEGCKKTFKVNEDMLVHKRKVHHLVINRERSKGQQTT